MILKILRDLWKLHEGEKLKQLRIERLFERAAFFLLPFPELSLPLPKNNTSMPMAVSQKSKLLTTKDTKNFHKVHK